jgi:hypothetical protein
VAKFAATDYKITVQNASIGTAAVDLTTNIASVELNFGYDELDVTAFSNPGKVSAQGLITGDVKLDFHQDFAGGTGSIDAILWTLTTATTLSTIVLTPTSATVGTNNPRYTCTVRPLQYTPLASSVGDLATVSVTWPLAANGTVAPVVRTTT